VVSGCTDVEDRPVDTGVEPGGGLRQDDLPFEGVEEGAGLHHEEEGTLLDARGPALVLLLGLAVLLLDLAVLMPNAPLVPIEEETEARVLVQR